MFPVVAAAHGTEKHSKGGKIEIKPSDVHEKCLKLSPGKVMDYSFEASNTLAFNLHYHLIEKTVFHVKEETAERKEVFHPVKDQNVYCMEWRNNGVEPVLLEYKYEIIDK
jgi:hypothetical protein